MDLTRLSVHEGSLSLSLWNYCYSCRLPGPVDGRMKFHLVIFLAAALFHRISAQCGGECSGNFRGKLVCALLNGCHLEMEYCSMMAHNCARLLKRKHLFLVINAGKCGEQSQPMCESMDF